MAMVSGTFTSRSVWIASPLNSRSSTPKSAHMPA
jgi:hypothetical protein